MIFFSKTYFRWRRIHLKRFQSDSGGLKIRNRVHKILLQKKPTILVYLVLLKIIIAMESHVLKNPYWCNNSAYCLRDKKIVDYNGPGGVYPPAAQRPTTAFRRAGPLPRHRHYWENCLCFECRETRRG